MRSHDIFHITGGQLRAARAFLRWSAEELATHTKLGVATIRRAEAQDGPLSLTPANVETIRQTLEGAGIQFIPENGGGPGVRLRHPIQRKTTGALRLDNPPAEDSD